MAKPPPFRGWPIVTGLILVTLFFLVVVVQVRMMTPRGWKGESYETKTFKGPTCSVRVTAFNEKTQGFALPGAYLGFDAAVEGSPSWTPVLETRHKDHIRVPDDCVRFDGLNNVTVVMGLQCMISSDGGKTWRAWDPRSQEK